MTVKDQRIKAMNEILNGIRVLKLYAWEMAFIRSITHIRDIELGYIRKKAIIGAVSNILWTFTPILVRNNQIYIFWIYCMYAFVKVGITTFATYVLSSSDNVLTADKAFVSLALFNLLRGPLNAFPNVITSVIEVNRKTLFCRSAFIFSLGTCIK
jgi:ATP-binding cassette subfamily C (CFTR/MRP) protein 1